MPLLLHSVKVSECCLYMILCAHAHEASALEQMAPRTLRWSSASWPLWQAEG